MFFLSCGCHPVKHCFNLYLVPIFNHSSIHPSRHIVLENWFTVHPSVEYFEPSRSRYRQFLLNIYIFHPSVDVVLQYHFHPMPVDFHGRKEQASWGGGGGENGNLRRICKESVHHFCFVLWALLLSLRCVAPFFLRLCFPSLL